MGVEPDPSRVAEVQVDSGLRHPAGVLTTTYEPKVYRASARLQHAMRLCNERAVRFCGFISYRFQARLPRRAW